MEPYFAIMHSFIPIAIGKNYYRKKIGQMDFSELATPTMEALVLVILTNSWDKWKEMASRNLKSSEARTKTLYTTKESKDNKASYSKRWASEGIRKFNSYVELVVADRASLGRNFDIFWKDKIKEELKTKKRNRRSTQVRKATLRARNCLPCDLPMLPDAEGYNSDDDHYHDMDVSDGDVNC